MLRVSYQELFDALLRVLLKLGFEPERARLCAQLFTDTSRDGVYSHGLNRFPRFVAMIRNGSIDIHAKPELVTGSGPLERWDGKIGPGNLNAHHCMDRTIALAREHGMGCVALANTNHWMRGGSYGWQAADAGMIGICWTNTLPNLPPWGAADPRVGNNPLVIAVPRADGHVVLDMAMSQFSYGTLASYRMRSELLPMDGGFDSNGRLTRVPGDIEASNRPLPIGFWKGSGLALMLDLVAAHVVGRKGHAPDCDGTGARERALAGLHRVQRFLPQPKSHRISNRGPGHRVFPAAPEFCWRTRALSRPAGFGHAQRKSRQWHPGGALHLAAVGFTLG